MAQATLRTDDETTTARTTDTERDACPECGGRLRPDGTEHVCEACALVADADRLDRGPEWQTFENGDQRGFKRCNGGPTVEAHHLGGHQTMVGLPGTSAVSGLNAAQRRRVARLRREHRRAVYATKLERARGHGLSEIRRVASMLDVPAQTRDRAARLFKDAHDANLLQGRSIDGFAAGALYAACRENRVARTLADIADVSQCSAGEGRLCYGVMNKELGLAAPPMLPRELVPRITGALGLPAELRAAAHDAAVAAENAGLHTGGRRPSSVAAAAVYHAAPGVTQAEVADAADCSPPTLRSAWKDLQAALDD